MLGRIVSNWLTETDERGYQHVYALLLQLQGHTVLHLSSHGPTEFGKDIITVGPSGIPCGFQLKVGDIDLGRWRAEVVDEVKELLDLPLEHPSLSDGAARRHDSYLVTTGTLKEPVRLQVEAMNRLRRRQRKRPLNLVLGSHLAHDLMGLHGDLPAWTPRDLERLLRLYSGDGTAQLDTASFAELLTAMFKREGIRSSARKQTALIAKGLLLTTYALEPYRREGNHAALAEGLTLFACRAVAHAEEFNLKEDCWRDTVSLAVGAARQALLALEREAAASRDFMLPAISDPLIAPARVTIVLTWIAALRLSRVIDDDGQWREPTPIPLIKRLLPRALVWGEAALPAWILAGMCARSFSEGALELQCIGTALDTLIARHGHGKSGLPSPYFGAEITLRNAFARQAPPEYSAIVCREPIDEGFNGHSFMMWPLVLLAARAGLRQTVKGLWPNITEVMREEFRADPVWEALHWRAAGGEQHGRFPPDLQSWRGLLDELRELEGGKGLPPRLRAVPGLVPLYAAAMPHRLTPELACFLSARVDEALDRN